MRRFGDTRTVSLMTTSVAIVIGGSRGAGRATALSLASEGYAVAVVYHRDQCAGETTVEEIVAAGGVALAIRADVTDPVDVDRVFAETVETLGRVEVVVHAACVPDALVHAQAALHAARWAGTSEVPGASAFHPDRPMREGPRREWTPESR